nr:MerR family transcriptional regulator [Actinoplanes toevensis]
MRYYECRGLLAEPDRSFGGHRLYPPEAVTVLKVIKAAQRLGFTLDEVVTCAGQSCWRPGGVRRAVLPFTRPVTPPVAGKTATARWRNRPPPTDR